LPDVEIVKADEASSDSIDAQSAARLNLFCLCSDDEGASLADGDYWWTNFDLDGHSSLSFLRSPLPIGGVALAAILYSARPGDDTLLEYWEGKSKRHESGSLRIILLVRNTEVLAICPVNGNDTSPVWFIRLGDKAFRMVMNALDISGIAVSLTSIEDLDTRTHVDMYHDSL
jgi:hypothetical protein